MRTKLGVLLLLCMVFALSSAAFATSYYVDSVGGSDTNNGTSTSTPWLTLTRASTQAYNPGDQVLLKRGCVWNGQMFTTSRSGVSGSPILLADYGSGALPRINGQNGSQADFSLVLQNVSYWTVRNLDLTQTGPQPPIPGTSDAKHSDEWLKYVFLIRGLNGGTSAHIRVENCVVHGATGVTGTADPLGANGLFIMGGYYQDDSGNSGYVDDVVVDGCEFYGNFKAGAEVSCRYTKSIIYTATNVSFLNCIPHDNGGDGIVVGPAQNCLIDNCVAYNNGYGYNARVGLWFWDSQFCVVQNSESYNNVVPPAYVGQSSARDGAGFDLDLGTMDCLIQYCYSHDNMGEAFLLMEWPIGYGFQRGYTFRITLRYSISEHDATDHGAPIEFFGGTEQTSVYNNTIYYIPERSAGSPVFDAEGGCVGSSKWGKSGVPTATFRNNIFICDKSQSQNPNAVGYLVHNDSGVLDFDYNCYWAIGTPVQFFWSGAQTWTQWQAAGRDAHGFVANPLFTGAFGGGEAAYHLQSGSPCRNTGIQWTDWYPGNMGTRDYYGNPNLSGGAYDIGCAEYQGGGSPPPAPTGLAATPGNAQNVLTWTASTGATSYNLKWGLTNGGPYPNVISGITGTSYTHTGLTNGTTYYYVVTAVNANGESGNSNQASGTPTGGGSPPPAPTNLVATPGNAQNVLTWTASTGATSYNLKWGLTNGGPYPNVISGITGTSYTHSGLTNGTTYYYVVTAVNANGESGNSNQASATPTGGGGGTVMHIADFFTCNNAGVPMSSFTSNNDPYWRVIVRDAAGAPVAGVTVVTKAYNPNMVLFMTKTGTTDANGMVHLGMNLVQNSVPGTWTVRVDSLTKTGWTRDLGADVRTEVTFQYQG